MNISNVRKFMKEKERNVLFPGKIHRGKINIHFVWITLFLLTVGFHASADPIGDKTVKFSKQVLQLKQLFSEIGTQAKCRFFYSDDEVDVQQLVKLPQLQLKVSEALKIGLGEKYTFKIEGEKIIITPVTKKTNASGQQVASIKISGKVTDASGAPLPGVTVVLSGTTIGTATDANGKYTLEVAKSDNIRLKFTFIGMKTQERIYRGEKELNVVLEEDAETLDEVVVTGIFDKPRESYTGAVSTITAKELKMYQGQNLLQTLRNIDPAINLVQDNMSGSNPNRVPNINIRGNSALPMSMKDLNEGVSAQLNTPLIIKDGFEITLQQLIDMNDNEVQSINIMKDASATAIYGSRGANGVIVITTKQPQAGKLRLSASAGVNVEIPDLSSYDLLDALEKIDFEYQMGLYSSIHPDRDAEGKKAYYDIRRDVLGGVDTYWLSQPLRTGVGQSYNLKLDGGSNEFRWSVEGNYNETIGVMKNSKRTNFSGVINLIYQRNNCTFMNQANYSRSRGDESNYGSFSEYAAMNPYWRLRDENGDYYERYYFAPTDTYVRNPLYEAQFDNKDQSMTEIFSDNFSIEWRPFAGFIVRGKIGVSKNFNTHDVFKSPNSFEFRSTTLSKRGSYDYTTGQSSSVDSDITLSYAKTLAETHQLYFGLNISAAQSKQYSYNFIMRGYNDRFDFLPNAVGYEENGKPSGSESTTRRVGYTFNFNYTFKNRYYADFSFRMDGSSQFGSNKRFAPFWSSGIGWNVHNEEFMKNTGIVDQLQLRFSYGMTGSQQFSSYQASTTYEYDVNDRYLDFTPAFLMGYGNENLKWQKTSMINAGLNFALFKRSITGSLDYYKNVTDNLLSPRTLLASTGFSSFSDNIGKVQNTGLELMLSGYPIRTSSGFTWIITGKMSRNKNKILELSPEIKRQTEEYMNNNVEMPSLMFEGGSTTDIYAVKSLGIDPSTGQELFYDKEGNITYEWNANAKRLVGNTEPKFRGNFSSNFRYKGFSLNLSFGFHFGGQQYNTTLINRVEIPRSALNKNVDRRVLKERWFYPGQLTFYKSFYDLEGNLAGATKASSRFVQDDNMFSLQGASASYQFTGNWIEKNLHMSMLEFSVNVSDLFYVSTIKRERGLVYPFSRRCAFSLKLMF